MNIISKHYKTISAALYLACGLFILAPFAAAFELQEHSASYSAKIKKGVSIKGSAVRSLSKLNDQDWLYQFDVSSFVADIKESSRFSVQEIKPLASESATATPKLLIKPQSYYYKLSAFLMPDRKREVQFDWQNQTASSPLKKDKWTLRTIPENTYDALSYQLQLLIDVDSGKKEMDYQLAHRGKLRDSKFIVLGKETIETQFGKLKSIVAKKDRDDDAKRETYLWFSEDVPLLLLKMTQKETDGEEYEINLESARIDGQKVDMAAFALK